MRDTWLGMGAPTVCVVCGAHPLVGTQCVAGHTWGYVVAVGEIGLRVLRWMGGVYHTGLLYARFMYDVVSVRACVLRGTQSACAQGYRASACACVTEVAAGIVYAYAVHSRYAACVLWH
jgi:hypothetical protein